MAALEESFLLAASGAKEMNQALEAVTKTVAEIGTEVVDLRNVIEKCKKEKRERAVDEGSPELHLVMETIAQMEARIMTQFLSTQEKATSQFAQVLTAIEGHYAVPPQPSQSPTEEESPEEEAKAQDMKIHKLKQLKIYQAGALQNISLTLEKIEDLLSHLSKVDIKLFNVLRSCLDNPGSFGQFLENNYTNMHKLQLALTGLVQMGQSDSLLWICENCVQGAEAKAQLIKQIEFTCMVVEQCQSTASMPSSHDISAVGREA